MYNLTEIANLYAECTSYINFYGRNYLTSTICKIIEYFFHFPLFSLLLLASFWHEDHTTNLFINISSEKKMKIIFLNTFDMLTKYGGSILRSLLCQKRGSNKPSDNMDRSSLKRLQARSLL